MKNALPRMISTPIRTQEGQLITTIRKEQYSDDLKLMTDDILTLISNLEVLEPEYGVVYDMLKEHYLAIRRQSMAHNSTHTNPILLGQEAFIPTRISPTGSTNLASGIAQPSKLSHATSHRLLELSHLWLNGPSPDSQAIRRRCPVSGSH